MITHLCVGQSNMKLY